MSRPRPRLAAGLCFSRPRLPSARLVQEAAGSAAAQEAPGGGRGKGSGSGGKPGPAKTKPLARAADATSRLHAERIFQKHPLCRVKYPYLGLGYPSRGGELWQEQGSQTCSRVCAYTLSSGRHLLDAETLDCPCGRGLGQRPLNADFLTSTSPRNYRKNNQ